MAQIFMPRLTRKYDANPASSNCGMRTTESRNPECHPEMGFSASIASNKRRNWQAARISPCQMTCFLRQWWSRCILPGLKQEESAGTPANCQHHISCRIVLKQLGKLFDFINRKSGRPRVKDLHDGRATATPKLVPIWPEACQLCCFASTLQDVTQMGVFLEDHPNLWFSFWFQQRGGHIPKSD